MSTRVNIQEYIDDYIPPPRPLAIKDCLKIYENLFSQDDLLLNQDITLYDPITFKRLSNPCRGVYCQHLQCFEYETYRELNRKKSPCEFVCPLCKESANPTKIYIDSIWINLLQHFPGTDTVKIYSNGNCESRYDRKTSSGVILIDDDDDEAMSSFSSFPSSSGATTSKSESNAPISIAGFTTYPPPLPTSSLIGNFEVLTMDDLFDCNIDDVLFFINNCKLQELQIIPSIGEYYAERIIKNRPFISCTFTALNHDLLLKLNRLRYPAAQSMIENLERVVKARLQQMKLRYQEIPSTRFQLQLEEQESDSKYIEKQPKIERKRLKRMREKSCSDDDDPFSPIKTEKPNPIPAPSLLPKTTSEASNKKRQLPESFSGSTRSDNSSHIFLEEGEKNKKQKKSKKDKKERKQKTQIGSNISSEDINPQPNEYPADKNKEREVQPSSPPFQGKKTYFSLSDDNSEERGRQPSNREPSIVKDTLDQTNYPDTTAVPSSMQPESSLKPSEVSTSMRQSESNNNSTWFDDRHVYVAPSLLLEEDDIFGLGFISTITRPLEDLDLPVAPSTPTKLSDTMNGSVIDLSKPKIRTEYTPNRHIRFSDEDSDTTTQTSSSILYDSESKTKSERSVINHHSQLSTSPKNWFHPVLPVPQISTTRATESNIPAASSKKHMQLLSVFNASKSSVTSASFKPSPGATDLSVPFPTIGMDNISDQVNNIIPFSTSSSASHYPRFPPHMIPDNNVSSSQHGRDHTNRNNRRKDNSEKYSRKNRTQKTSSSNSNHSSSNNGSSDPSSSIVQLMISEFATG